MKKSTRLLVVHLSIMSLLHSLGACQVPKMGIFSFHFMCLPSIHHIMLSCFYRIFRISTVQCEIVNQFFFSKKKKNSLCICAFSADQYLGFRDQRFVHSLQISFKLLTCIYSFLNNLICRTLVNMEFKEMLLIFPHVVLNSHMLWGHPIL